MWTFYAALPGTRFPAHRRETHADFGLSDLGSGSVGSALEAPSTSVIITASCWPVTVHGSRMGLLAVEGNGVEPSGGLRRDLRPYRAIHSATKVVGASTELASTTRRTP
jgi:hypothetical protein